MEQTEPVVRLKRFLVGDRHLGQEIALRLSTNRFLNVRTHRSPRPKQLFGEHEFLLF